MQRKYYKTKVGNENVSANFKYKEFACKDGTDEFLLDKDMIPVIQKFREEVDHPVPIASAYRTPSYNKKIGGRSGSYHLKGQAFDIHFNKNFKKYNSIMLMGAYFNTMKVKGIIKYSWGFHIDLRDYVYHATNTGKGLALGKVNISFKTLRKGDKNNDVGCLQFMLKQRGYRIDIDSIFGQETRNAVLHFQDTRNIKIDGIVGAETWRTLIAD